MNKIELIQEFSSLVDEMEKHIGNHFKREQYLKNKPFFVDGKVIKFDENNEVLHIPFKNNVNFYGYECELDFQGTLKILEKNMKIIKDE
ncbi:MAG: hypothetical protein ACK4UK_07330 [Flavobacterium sp.]